MDCLRTCYIRWYEYNIHLSPHLVGESEQPVELGGHHVAGGHPVPVDQPQHLWEAIDFTLARGIETVIHVGPQPNIIPATFNRLAANVANQSKDSRRMRALSTLANRPWLGALLPRRASLLRATQLRQINLEDWLLDQKPASEANQTVKSATG